MLTVETLNAVVDGEVEQLPADMRARLVHLGSIIEAVGFDGLPADTVKHLNWSLPGSGRTRPSDQTEGSACQVVEGAGIPEGLRRA